jgi:hypothetical protein
LGAAQQNRWTPPPPRTSAISATYLRQYLPTELPLFFNSFSKFLGASQ